MAPKPGNRLFHQSWFFQGVKNVIIPNKVTQNVELFVDALETCQVTRLFAVTSLIKNLLTFVQMEAKQKKSKPRLNKVIRILKMTIVCWGLNLLIKGWVNQKRLPQQEWYPIKIQSYHLWNPRQLILSYISLLFYSCSRKM